MAYIQKSKGSTFKMMGSSPARDGQVTKRKLKKKLIGPTKPMVDQDGDGIPAGIDLKDTPGGKHRHTPKKELQPTTNKQKDKKGMPPSGPNTKEMPKNHPVKPPTTNRVDTLRKTPTDFQTIKKSIKKIFNNSPGGIIYNKIKKNF